MESPLTISRIAATAPRYAEVLELREEILRKPLGLSLYNEDRSRDLDAETFIAEAAGRIIACLLLNKVGEHKVQLRAMAVENGWQGKGVGRILVGAAESYCREQKIHSIMLHARKVAMGFYASMGYGTCSEEFTEVGIPHFIMEKML